MPVWRKEQLFGDLDRSISTHLPIFNTDMCAFPYFFIRLSTTIVLLSGLEVMVSRIGILVYVQGIDGKATNVAVPPGILRDE